MSRNPYESPSSELKAERPLDMPSAYAIAAGLCAISIGVGIVGFLVEYFLGIILPASGFLSTILPALTVSSYYSSRIGVSIPARTKFIALFLWGVVCMLLAYITIYLVEPALIEELAGSGGIFVGIFLGAMLFAFGIAYLAFLAGEKMGINTWKKKNGVA